MSYIILRDTLGCGLTAFDSMGLEVLSPDQLADGICVVGQELLDERGVESLSEYEEDSSHSIADEIVICEVVDKIDGLTDVNDYIRSKIVESEVKQATEEYELYLKLKEKYDK